MAVGLVTRIPFVLPGASAYPTDAAQLAPLVPLPYETDAAAHWFLGSDNPQFLDRVAGLALTRGLWGTVASNGTGYPASARVPLIFAGGIIASGGTAAAGYAVTNASGVPTNIVITGHGNYQGAPTATLDTSGGGSGGTVTIKLATVPTLAAGLATVALGSPGLVTPFDDAADWTSTHVFPKHGSINSVVSDTGRASTATGCNIFNDGANGYKVSTNIVLGSTSTPAPTGAAVGAPIFMGVSHNSATGIRTTVFGNGATYTTSITKALDALPRTKISMGNVNLGDVFGFGATSAFHSKIEFARPLSASEMLAVYAREKVRLAARGVVVF